VAIFLAACGGHVEGGASTSSSSSASESQLTYAISTTSSTPVISSECFGTNTVMTVCASSTGAADAGDDVDAGDASEADASDAPDDGDAAPVCSLICYGTCCTVTCCVPPRPGGY